MWLRYVIFTTLILCIFVCNFLFHISRILMYILSFQGDPKAPTLRKKWCPNYDKLRQFFASIIPIPFKFPQICQPQIVMKSMSWRKNLPMRHIVSSWVMMIATIPKWRAYLKMIPLFLSKPNVRTNVPSKSLLPRGRRLPRKWIGLVR